MNDRKHQTLYLLRHARAEPWSPGLVDFERALNRKGVAHSLLLADWVARTLAPPELILCSPAKRTRETLAPVLTAWRDTGLSVSYVEEIYEATTGTLHARVSESFRAADRVMLVGHNPGLEYLALGVLRDEDAADINRMPAGTLAVIEFRHGWDEDAGAGRLRHWKQHDDLS